MALYVTIMTRGLLNNFLRFSQLGLWYWTRSSIWTTGKKTNIAKEKENKAANIIISDTKYFDWISCIRQKYMYIGECSNRPGAVFRVKWRPPHPFVLLVLNKNPHYEHDEFHGFSGPGSRINRESLRILDDCSDVTYFCWTVSRNGGCWTHNKH